MALTGITKIGGAALEDPLLLEGDLHVSGITTFTKVVQAQAGVSGQSVIGIQSATTQIGVGVTQLNFIGVGNTFHFDSATSTVDVSIAGGGGGGGIGTAIKYADDVTKSPFSYIEPSAIVEENLNITTTNAGVTSTYVVSVVPTINVASGVAVTVGSGKSMIIDVLQLGGT